MVHDMPIRPSSLATISRDVERVLAIALAKKKAERFQTATDLAVALGDAFAKRLPSRFVIAPSARSRAPVERERYDSHRDAWIPSPCGTSSLVATRPIRARVIVSPSEA